MAKLYKLTDEKGQTMGKTQWGPGVTHTAKGKESQGLCSDGWIHSYTSPLLAVLLNPIHASFPKPRLWEAEGEIGKEERGLKIGCRTLTAMREIPIPLVTTTQCIAFGILCAMQVEKSKKWLKWAEKWVRGEDRTADAAYAAADAAYAAHAAHAAAAAHVAYAATAAAAYAAAHGKVLPLVELAEQAMRY